MTRSWLLVHALLVLSLAATARATEPPAPADTSAAAPSRPHLDLATARLVDLSHAYGAETLYWPAQPPQTFALEVLHHGPTPGGFFYAANKFCAPEHGGTHLDAPLHFGEGQWSAAEVPVDRLVAPALVIDVRAPAAADRDYRLTAADVAAWEARHGRIAGGAIVLLRTGWSERWPDRARYFGNPSTSDASDLHFPSFGAAAVKVLLERGVAALGVDTASIDHGPSHDFPVHRLVAAANVPAFENLDHLDALPETGAWLVALPMKIGDGTGGPLRAVALLPP
ncbi:MAG TPA: cyclase family protein [Thermoanaerobaculia bacterium]|jgi:kynurenine formamidase|nr:cyclase family protein [Thermoanaerobaculia bacterium]